MNSILQPANSGNAKTAIGSPKFRMVFGPFDKTEFFVGAGMGYHSNDARSTTVTEVPGDPTTPEGASPLLVRSRGAEVGVRTKIVPDLDSSVSLFYLHQDSELFFDGDTGDTSAGRPSQRTGIEFTNDYRPASWLHVDADLALTRARFLGFDTAQEATLPIARRLSAGADRQRAGQLCLQRALDGGVGGHHARREHRLVRRSALALYQFAAADRGRRLPVAAVEHLQRPSAIASTTAGASSSTRSICLNSTTDNATYAYGSLLKTDICSRCANPHAPPPAAVCQNGVMDYVCHPIEPLSFRLTLAGPLELIGTLNVAAMAAELTPLDSAFRPVQPANYDWTGFYIGGHVDDAWSKTNSSTVDTATGAVAASVSSASQWHGGVAARLRPQCCPPASWSASAADVSSGNTKTTTATDASGTSAKRTTVFDSEIRARAARLRIRQCLVLRHRRLGVVERSVHPNPALGHA